MDSSDLLRQIYLELRNVHDLSVKLFSKKTSEFGVTVTQFGIMRTMPEDGHTCMSQLIHQVGCVPSNMTAIIQRMERDEQVSTYKNPSDNRETLVRLTKKGLDMRRELEPMYQSFLEECFGHLDLTERQQFLHLLLKQKRRFTSS